MFKLVIKYFILPLFLYQIIFAQENISPFKDPSSSDNALRLTLTNSDHSIRSTIESANQMNNTDPFLKFNEMKITNKDNFKDNYLKDNSNEIKNNIIIQPISSKTSKNKINKPKFNIVSSFRENIHFAGFYDRYAIINFTPALNIKPFDFININANQNYSCFIPISGIKEHFKMLCIQGISILAVDNSIKLIFGTDKMIPSIVGYAAKNIIISLLKSVLEKKSNNQIYSYNSYYYSIIIKL